MPKAAASLVAALTLLMSIAGGAHASRGIEVTPRGRNWATGFVRFSSPEAELVNFEECIFEFRLDNIGEGGTAKETSTVVANVTSASASICEGGTMRMLSPSGATPWRVTYNSFTGTLPRISAVSLEIRGMGLLIENAFARCLYGGNTRVWTVGGTRVTDWSFEVGTPLPLVTELRGLFRCPRSGTLTGVLTLERSWTLRLV